MNVRVRTSDILNQFLTSALIDYLMPDDVITGHVTSVLLYHPPLLSLFTRLNPPDLKDFERRWEQEGKTGSVAPGCWFQIPFLWETQLRGGQTDSTRAFTASGARTSRFWIKPKPLKPQRISTDREFIWKEWRDCCGESRRLTGS